MNGTLSARWGAAQTRWGLRQRSSDTNAAAPRHAAPTRGSRPFGTGSASHASSSGANEEEDSDLSREFETAAAPHDPTKRARQAEHLELLWKVSERKEPEVCTCCLGSKELECTWCHGTGVMTVGDQLFCSDQGCRPCPVCSGHGHCKCEYCRGTGKRAPWMKAGQCPTPL